MTLRVRLLTGTAILLTGWTIATISYNPKNLLVTPYLLTALVLVGCLLWEGRFRGRGFATPLAFASVVYLSIFCFVPLADLWFGHPIIHNSLFVFAGWLATGGAVLMYLGYRLGLRASFQDHPLVWHSRRALFLAVSLLAVGVGTVIFQFGGVEGVTMLVSNFGARRTYFTNSPAVLAGVSLAVPATVLLMNNWIVSRRHLTLVIAAIPVALAVSSYFGQRWRALALLVAIGALVHLGLKRLPTLVLGLLGVLLVAAFVLAGVYRNVIGTDRTAKDISGRNFYDNYVGQGHEVGQFRDFILTLEGVPGRVPYQHGKTFLSIIPGAPYPTGGYVFSTVFFPDLYRAGTSIPTPLPGELYMNFGLAAIFIGMLLYGATLGVIHSYFETGPTLRATPIYAYSLLPLALILRGDFTTFAGWYLLGLAVLWISLRYATKTPGKSYALRKRRGWGEQ